MGELKHGKAVRHTRSRLVWEAWIRGEGEQGCAGVDGQSIEEFEKDLKDNLYKLWNRMSSGTYFPPPVRAVEIPKEHGGDAGSRGAHGGGIVPHCPVIPWVSSLSPIRSTR